MSRPVQYAVLAACGVGLDVGVRTVAHAEYTLGIVWVLTSAMWIAVVLQAGR